MTGASDCINKSLKGYLNISALTMSIGVFILGRYLCEKKWNDKLKCIIVELSKYTFGIYLVHYYFVLAVPKILMINIASIWWRTFGSIFIFSLN